MWKSLLYTFLLGLWVVYAQKISNLSSLKQYSSVPIHELEQTKLFGRFADKILLLDVPGAGTPEIMNCCHGGCDNCNYSHIFDCLTAGRSKWIAAYPFRKLIDGREHKSPWSNIFYCDFTQANIPIDLNTFKTKVESTPFRSCLGPSKTVNAEELPEENSIQYLWNIVHHVLQFESVDVPTDFSPIDWKDERLSAEQFGRAISLLTGEEHGCAWNEFKQLF